MTGDERQPKYTKIPINHLPTWKKPVKLFTYFISILTFNFLTYREIKSRDSPKTGAEGQSMLGRFQYWFYNRTKAYATIVLLVLMAMKGYELYLYTGTIPSQIYGLSLDMIGAIVVARGLFRGYAGFLIDANIS